MTPAKLQLDLVELRDLTSPGGASWLLDPRLWAVALACLAAVMVAAAVVDLVRRDRIAGGPEARRLARSLGLRASDRRRLGRLARAAGLPSEACLMISRGCIEHAVVAGMTQADQAAIEGIRAQLFDAEEEPVHSAA